jgi:hypothetical protein
MGLLGLMIIGGPSDHATDECTLSSSRDIGIIGLSKAYFMIINPVSFLKNGL